MKSFIFYFTITACLCANSMSVTGQSVVSWGQIYDIGKEISGGLYGAEIAQLDNGEIILAATFDSENLQIEQTPILSNGKKDIILLRFSPSGSLIKKCQLGNYGNEEVSAIAVDADNNVYVAGTFDGDFFQIGDLVVKNKQGKDVFIAKLTSEFELVWLKTFGDDVFDANVSDIKISVEGELVASGNFNSNKLSVEGFEVINSFKNEKLDIWLLKLSNQGSVEWLKSVGGELDDFSGDVAINSEGDVFLSGNVFSTTLYFENKRLPTNGNRDCFLAKYSKNGDLVKAIGIGSEKYDFIHDFCLDNSDNLIATGAYVGPAFFVGDTVLVNPSGGGADFYLLKLSKNLEIDWVRSSGNWNSSSGYEISRDEKGNVYILGGFDSPEFEVGRFGFRNNDKFNHYVDLWFSKWSPSGDLLWGTSFGGLKHDWGSELLVISEDEFLLSGNTESCNISFDGLKLEMKDQVGQYLVRFRKQDKAAFTYQNPSNISIDLFPTMSNKSTSQVTLSINNAKVDINCIVEVLSTEGERLNEYRLKTNSPEFRFNIPIHGYRSGTYFVRVTAGNETVTETLIIQ